MENPRGPTNRRVLLIIVLAVLVGCMIVCCGVGTLVLPPAIQQAREAARRQQAAENLRQIDIALKNYHATYHGKLTQRRGTPAMQEDGSLNPEFPVVEGKYRMAETWSVTLPEKFNWRIEEGDLVLWRQGVTIWVSTWNNDRHESPVARLASLRQDMSPNAFDVEEVSDENLLRLAYRLNEPSEERRSPAFHGFVVGADGHLQLAIYFDDEQDETLARPIWLSVKERESESP